MLVLVEYFKMNQNENTERDFKRKVKHTRDKKITYTFPFKTETNVCFLISFLVFLSNSNSKTKKSKDDFLFGIDL